MRLPVGAGRTALLRRLAGEEELRLLDIPFGQGREWALSHALAASVEELGGVASPGPAFLHSRPLCERHALVRSLWLASGAGLAETVAVCACGEKVELGLDLVAIELPALAGDEVPLKLAGVRRPKRLHLPTPADLEECFTADALMARCLRVAPEAVEPMWPAAEEQLATSDPLGDIVLSGPCPGCGSTVEALLDLPGLWLRQMQQRASALLEEIHQLALHYHWSETEILRVPQTRRQAYLDLCWSADIRQAADA